MTDTDPPLTTEQVAGLLRATAVTLRAEFDALGTDGARWHPAPGEWCLNEVLGHLLEAEQRGFAGRIQRIIDQPGRRLQTWDQAAVTKARQDCEKPGLMAEFERVREESIILALSLQPEQLALTGDHPQVGELSIANLIHEWPHHDRSHVKQALSNVQAYAWLHMGNSRRFAEID